MPTVLKQNIMRLAVFFHEPPVPALHGGRVDVWRRLKAFSKLGVELAFIGWRKPSDSAPHIIDAELGRYVSRRMIFEQTMGALGAMRRLLRLSAYPWAVTSRILDGRQQRQLEAFLGEFSPDWIWSESLYCGVTALRAAEALGKPFAYRSHNIEHQYMYNQARLEKNPKARLQIQLSLLHLKSIEEKLIGSSNIYFDISMDDLRYWQGKGHGHGMWLPPNVDDSIMDEWDRVVPESPRVDVAFMGNLSTPNNIDGICWFLDEVLPRLRLSKADVSVVIAGSKPTADIQRAASAASVTLIANPDSAIAVMKRARVLINPVRQGSGVNVKSVEMLYSDAELVTTSQGVAGLPEQIKQAFRIADSAASFAAHIAEALAHPHGIADLRNNARGQFLSGNLSQVIDSLQSVTS